jgi:hypothetical protein
MSALTPDTVFTIANDGILLFWLLLIVAPFWRGTKDPGAFRRHPRRARAHLYLADLLRHALRRRRAGRQLLLAARRDDAVLLARRA